MWWAVRFSILDFGFWIWDCEAHAALGSGAVEKPLPSISRPPSPWPSPRRTGRGREPADRASDGARNEASALLPSRGRTVDWEPNWAWSFWMIWRWGMP